MAAYTAHAQYYNRNDEVGVLAGAAGYMGDINPNNPLLISGYSASVFYKKHFNPYLGARISYTHGKVAGYDANSNNAFQRERNLSFYSNLDEIVITGEFNFLRYFSGGGNKIFSPYIFAGFGGMLFNPKTTYQGPASNNKLVTVNLRDHITEVARGDGSTNDTYSNFAYVVPYGVGTRYNFKSNFSFMFEAGYRTVFSDNLDDIGQGNFIPVSNPWIDPYVPLSSNQRVDGIPDAALSYRGADVYKSQGTGTFGVQRGDGRNKDTYFFFQVGVSYTFTRIFCPRF